ncbi:hypothetical protein BKK79_04600 [Cupriavidus sp. USMAA2-4]|uniref:DUF2501 domain-containing protein n=1 Tax=Cupriavidus malaysiensis TaxID=367825 RepID=A0ABM6F2P0_9BURK|nr:MULTISPECIES: DUF2501 domain-containing protein [Cupriavidus]AOY91177.1 hypothetical protein BKK79_04600 [Cupriavidus sp. USMAA2-4]AOY99248.1 hypothetical protein BKK81_08230 [Cupriavidus sp. USMAHM13]AOZ05671.1 hypothetical protein BKK80_07535 [Cupriavidus malaysiensis]
MKARTHRAAMAVLLGAALLAAGSAQAQLGDLLNKAGGGSSSGTGSLGNLGGALSGQSLVSGSTGNVAGLLEFCIKNNYLGGNAASSVKNSLMGKLGGSAGSDSGYSSGAKGILDSGNGQQLDLSGGGLKAEMTKQVCDKVLAQGKSLL